MIYAFSKSIYMSAHFYGVAFGEVATGDLQLLCKQFHVKLNGVFAKDEIRPPLKNGGYICNLENSDEDGSHWVAFLKEGADTYYFDSYGAPPIQNLVDSLPKFNMLLYNAEQIQDLSDTTCGFYCVAFLLAMKMKYQYLYVL